MIKPQSYTFTEDGGVCVLWVNGREAARMDYTTALEMAQLMRMSGKRAKSNVGDQSRHWSVIANLTDGNAEELKTERNRDATAVLVPR